MEFAREFNTIDAAAHLLGGPGDGDTYPKWLVADAALVDPGGLQQLLRSLQWNAANALQGSTLEVFHTHSPQLIGLPEDRASTLAGLQRLLDLDRRAPAFSVIESRATLPELQMTCSYLALSRVDADILVHCRFADVRILPELLDVLSVAQRARVALTISGWSWANHVGVLRRWYSDAAAVGDKAADASGHLELSKTQFATMLDASEPDTVFSLLLENTPELVPTDRRGHFRDRLSGILRTASSRRLISPMDRFQFAILSLSCSERFHLHPSLRSTWQAIESQGSTLVEQMKLWSDELWEELQAEGRVSTT